MIDCLVGMVPLSPQKNHSGGLNSTLGAFSVGFLCFPSVYVCFILQSRQKNLCSPHRSESLSMYSWLILTRWILRMSRRQYAVMKPGCFDCCVSWEMYSTERLSYYIILWTDFSPLGGDLSLACHGSRIQSAAASGGLWQICRALGDNSWSWLSALHHSLRKSVKGMHLAFISTHTSTGCGSV